MWKSVGKLSSLKWGDISFYNEQSYHPGGLEANG